MLSCTNRTPRSTDGATHEPDRVFHYLPFNFAASTILLLSCLARESVLILSTDLNRLADEISLASPAYFLNVPRCWSVSGVASKTPLQSGLRSSVRCFTGHAPPGSGSTLAAAAHAHSMRCGSLSAAGSSFERFEGASAPTCARMICGSAPLAPETQQFFLMLGIPVLQAYGLTETTGIARWMTRACPWSRATLAR